MEINTPSLWRGRMNAENAIRKFIKTNETDVWIEHSDGYQFLLENCGDKLLPGLLRLSSHQSREVRAMVAALLATRRPHTTEIVNAFRLLLDDPEPYVRVAALDHLSELGDHGLAFVPRVAEMLERAEGIADLLEKVSAISFLLNHDQKSWGHLIGELFEILGRGAGTMAEYSALETLVSLGLVEFEEG
jgi:hypothetical protein